MVVFLLIAGSSCGFCGSKQAYLNPIFPPQYSEIVLPKKAASGAVFELCVFRDIWEFDMLPQD